MKGVRESDGGITDGGIAKSRTIRNCPVWLLDSVIQVFVFRAATQGWFVVRWGRRAST